PISLKNLSQRREMTLPQRNTALARPTNFYYLMCKLDRAQYRLSQPPFLFYNQKRRCEDG
ncbi:hypothetical protein, partial [Limosilactobacillus portuensis]|uniref:hypothetical protein n=1 Tax=Limosilactobacillus portuensis TaxID=2742601 RepID=UPI0019D5773F